MPQRFTNPVIKYTTDTLKTLPGALLYFYENGTSTPKAVYQDVALTTPHTNPVVASSAGNFAPIFLAGTYRVELKNAAGVTQSGWPVDNVGGEETQGQFDDWSSITSYFEGDLVTGSNGLRYQATLLQPNLNRDPLTSPTYWTEVRFTSEYNPLSSYAVGDWVYYNNDWYKCKAVALGQTPSPHPLRAFWARYVQGCQGFLRVSKRAWVLWPRCRGRGQPRTAGFWRFRPHRAIYRADRA